jgi:hypothetical protein
LPAVASGAPRAVALEHLTDDLDALATLLDERGGLTGSGPDSPTSFKGLAVPLAMLATYDFRMHAIPAE